MKESRVDVGQLRRRDPVAWTALLQADPALEDVAVTAVATRPFSNVRLRDIRQHITHYVLALDGHSDPITLIGKRTNRIEALFYRQLAAQLPHLAPRCWYTYLFNDEAWIVLDDVPNDFPPEKWVGDDVERVIHEMALLHAAWGQQSQALRRAGLEHFVGDRRISMDLLRQEQAVYFEEGPAALLSEHALQHVGRLAGRFLQAANGLLVMRSLDGWPGILGESHLVAAADLLDDPVPMLQPLLELPVTLLHGNPYPQHWHLTLFAENRLLDWQKAMIGPGLLDFVAFLEQFDLLHNGDDAFGVTVRPERPLSEETMIDSYLLTLSAELGSDFDARAVRQALPAARCLFILTNWFPHFATWFDEMPNKYTWQKINRLSDEQLRGSAFQPMIGFRPYLSQVFTRFLHSFRRL